MKLTSHVTRRAFSQGLASSFMLSAVNTPYLRASGDGRAIAPGRFAYVGSSPAESAGAIHVFDTTGDQWRRVETFLTPAPAFIVFNELLPVIYVVHAVEQWANLPRGAVSSYRVDSESGRLALLNTQPLSLSATFPRHASMVKDGRHLLVAAEGGGVYNVLPISENGSLLPPSAILKEVGSTDSGLVRLPRPSQILNHPHGKIFFVADGGNEALTALILENGGLRVVHRVSVPRSASPSQIAISHCGRWIYSLSARDNALSLHYFDEGLMQIEKSPQVLQIDQTVTRSIVMHPSRPFLISSGQREGLYTSTSHSIDSNSGLLTKVTSTRAAASGGSSVLYCHRESLFEISTETGCISKASFDPLSGALDEPQEVAQVDFAVCLAFSKPAVARL
jgi:6-phosphogluconolactonase